MEGEKASAPGFVCWMWFVKVLMPSYAINVGGVTVSISEKKSCPIIIVSYHAKEETEPCCQSLDPTQISVRV